MSELKSQIALLQGLSYVEYREVYLKSEADKVIADLEKKIKFLQVTAICKDCDRCAERLGMTLDGILTKRDVDDVLKEIENDILED